MIFGKKCMVVSVDVRRGKDDKSYGSVMLSDGKDALKFDCDVELCARVQPFTEYDCFIDISEQSFGDKVYNRRRLIETRVPGEK